MSPDERPQGDEEPADTLTEAQRERVREYYLDERHELETGEIRRRRSQGRPR